MGAFVLLAAAVLAQVPDRWESVGVGGGGALFAPGFSPHAPDELYVSCDMSQYFHTTTLGASWRVVPFRRLTGGRSGSAVRWTADPRVLYAIDFAGDVRRPVRSDDGGVTWKPLAGDPTGADAWHLFVHPADPRRVLVTSYADLWVSFDSGATFARRFAGPAAAGLHVGGAYFDGSFIALGTNAGVLVSLDGGLGFAAVPIPGLPAGEAIVSFAGARAGGVVRFFCVTADAAGVYAGILGDDHGSWRGVYALDPGAAGWTRRTTGLAAGAHPFYVATSPARPDVAWLAGGSDAGTPIVYRTTDGAATWRSVLLTSGNQNVATGWSGSGGDRDWSYGEFAFGLAAHPVDPGRAAFTDLGFVHVTSDGGASWRQAYVERGSQNPPGAPTPRGRHYRSAGLENTSCWWLSWLDPRTLWAGFSDIRGARSVDGGVAWGFDYTGHTLNSAYQSVAQPGGAGTLFLATSSVHDLYMSTYLTDARIDGGSGQVRFSNDKGKTWQQLGSLGKPVIGLALDPNQPHRLYASMVHATLGGIYACPDVRPGTGATWTRLAAPPRTQGHAHSVHALRDGTLVCTYSGRRAGNPLNFTSSSGVFVSTDGGANWQDRSHPDMQWWTKDLVIDPHDATQSTWYVGVFSGWGGPANDRGGLFRTTNRGLNWTRLWTNSHVDSCAVDPADRKQMYVTTEHDGLWWTGNLLAAQPVFRRVESLPFRQPVRVFFNPHAPREVWVTSFGGGLRVGRR